MTVALSKLSAVFRMKTDDDDDYANNDDDDDDDEYHDVDYITLITTTASPVAAQNVYRIS